MTTQEFELFLNHKLQTLLERDVYVNVLNGVNEDFIPCLRFIYKHKVIYEYRIGEYSPFKLSDIEYNMVTYKNDPLTLSLIEKIEEFDKNSWYVFLAP